MTGVTGDAPGGAPLLEVEDLSVSFNTRRGVVRAVDGLSYSLDRGQSLGIVGESGSGKTVGSLSILRLFGLFDDVTVTGAVRFEGRDLLRLSEAEMSRVRGGQIGMIFQDPLTSLNPVMPVGEQVAESLRFHTGASRRRPAAAPSSCWTGWASPTRPTATTSCPTASAAGCASG